MTILPERPALRSSRAVYHHMVDQAVTIVRHVVGGVPVITERIERSSSNTVRTRTYHRICTDHLQRMVRNHRHLRRLKRTVDTLPELRALVAEAYELLGHATILEHAPMREAGTVVLPSRMNSDHP